MSNLPKFKGVRQVFADGTELVVPPLNLAAVEVLQERLVGFTGELDPKSVALVVDATLMAGGTNIHYLEEWLDQHKR